jgi:hypothetical protein
MSAFMKTLVAVLTVGPVGLATTSAVACHGGSGGYGGYSSHYYPEYVRHVYVKEPIVVAPTFAPAHSLVVVMPGDSWFSICTREYGNSGVWSRVADFNGMPQNMPLNIGMQLRLPVVNSNGSFSLSSAPAAFTVAPQGFAGGFPQAMPQGAQLGQQGSLPPANGFVPQGQGFAPQQAQVGLPQGAQLGQQIQQLAPQSPMAPQAPEVDSKNVGMAPQATGNQLNGLPGQSNDQPAGPNAAPTDRPIPSILIGSIMAINGQPLGDNRGTVRLVVNGSPIALEIVEWSASAAKVRVPNDLAAGIQAQIEILRADGSVVAKDAVQLVAGPKVAAAN